MTKEVPRKRFPQALVIFNNVVESADNVPTEVKRLRRAISESLAENNQRSALNRRFCRQREINPKFFPKVVAWLFRQDTVRRFKKAGGYWAVQQLTSALPKISHGAKPHVALGMNKGGASEIWGFTVAEDALIYARHLHLNEGYSIDNAKQVSANLFGIDKANINKAKIPPISAIDADEQAGFIKLKYKLP